MPISPGFVTLNVTAEAREQLRSLTYALTGATGRRVTLSDALIAACAVASQQIEAAAESLEEGTDSEQQ